MHQDHACSYGQSATSAPLLDVSVSRRWFSDVRLHGKQGKLEPWTQGGYSRLLLIAQVRFCAVAILDGMGRILYFDDQPIEVFPIGDLAAALERSPATVRRWEQMGDLRKGFRRRSTDIRGDRRFYTRSQIKLVSNAAWNAGVRGPRSSRVDLLALGEVLRRIPRETWLGQDPDPPDPGEPGRPIVERDCVSRGGTARPRRWADICADATRSGARAGL